MNRFLRRGLRHLQYRVNPGALILVYHRISDVELDPWSLSVTPDHFTEHMAVLRRSFHLQSFEGLAQSLRDGTRLSHKSIVITFDDGYADNLYAARPLLDRFDCPATVFLTTAAIGSSHDFWWDELTSLLLKAHRLPGHLELSIQGKAYAWQFGEARDYSEEAYSRDIRWRVGQPPPTFRHQLYKELWQLIQPLSPDTQQEVMEALRAWADHVSNPPMHRILNQEECIELGRAENIEIGAHTIHHVSLASLPVESQCKEISGSKAALEELLNRPVKSFSYPFGKQQDYSPQTVTLVQEAGFFAACCNSSGVISANTDPFQLPRIHIHDCDGHAFEQRLLSKFYAG